MRWRTRELFLDGSFGSALAVAPFGVSGLRFWPFQLLSGACDECSLWRAMGKPLPGGEGENPKQRLD